MTAPEIRADRTDLLTGSGRWLARVDDLAVVRREIDSVPVGGLGGRVAPVAALVLDGWAARTSVLGGAAQRHADAVGATWRGLEATDGSVAGRLGGGS